MRGIATVILLLLENIVVVAMFFGGLLYVDYYYSKPTLKSVLENPRARVPYVMFRPKRGLVPFEFKSHPDHHLPFGNWKALLTVLDDAKNSDKPTPARRVFELLPDGLRGRFSVNLSEADKQVFFEAINKMAKMPEFYNEKYHSDLYVPKLYLKFIQSKDKGKKQYGIFNINRSLLEQTFPDKLGAYVRINSWGFNSPEMSDKKKENEFRIAVVGGSVVYGGSLHAWTPAGQLAEVLREKEPSLKGKKITYINAGIPSGVSGQELAQLMWYVLPMNIDLLVIYDGYNDFFIPFNYERRPGYPYDYYIDEFRYYMFERERSATNYFFDLFKRPSEHLNLAAGPRDFYRDLGVFPEEYIGIDEKIPVVLNIYFNNVDRMMAVARAYNIKAAAFLQPYSPAHHDINRAERAAVVKLYELADERYKELAKNNSPMQVYKNLHYLHVALKDLFLDIGHYKTPEGNRIAAEAMYEAMKKHGMFDAVNK